MAWWIKKKVDVSFPSLSAPGVPGPTNLHVSTTHSVSVRGGGGSGRSGAVSNSGGAGRYTTRVQVGSGVTRTVINLHLNGEIVYSVTPYPARPGFPMSINFLFLNSNPEDVYLCGFTESTMKEINDICTAGLADDKEGGRSWLRYLRIQEIFQPMFK